MLYVRTTAVCRTAIYLFIFRCFFIVYPQHVLTLLGRMLFLLFLQVYIRLCLYICMFMLRKGIVPDKFVWINFLGDKLLHTYFLLWMTKRYICAYPKYEWKENFLIE